MKITKRTYTGLFFLLFLILVPHYQMIAQTSFAGTKEKPYKTIEQALNAVKEGDTIHITAGKYVPTENSFEIKTGCVIMGGYDESFTAITPGTTIWSGDVNGNDEYDEISGELISGYEDNRYRVARVMGEATDVVIENIKIQGGYADTNGNDTGGGMMIQGNSVTLKNMIFTGNYCSGAGGGALHVRTNLVMDKCEFYGNIGAGDGGAVFINGEAVVEVKNSLFQHNISTSGAAIFLKNAISTWFAGNTFLDNQSKTYGTFTVYNTSLLPERTVTLVNNTFANNQVSGDNEGGTCRGGSAIYVRIHKDGWVKLVNNTIIANTNDARDEAGAVSSFLGGALFARQGNVKLANNIIAGNFSASGYGDIFETDGVIHSLQYNLFTTPSSVNLLCDEREFFVGESVESSLEIIAKTLDAFVFDGKLIANPDQNGGTTPTVSVLEGTDRGVKLSVIPDEHLQESFLEVDLDNDGKLDSYLATDQRGAKKDRNGEAYIGAYEPGDPLAIGISSDRKEWIRVIDKQLFILTDKPFEYSVYDISGSVIKSGRNQKMESSVDLHNLPTGIYLVKIISEGKKQVGKIIL